MSTLMQSSMINVGLPFVEGDMVLRIPAVANYITQNIFGMVFIHFGVEEPILAGASKGVWSPPNHECLAVHVLDTTQTDEPKLYKISTKTVAPEGSGYYYDQAIITPKRVK